MKLDMETLGMFFSIISVSSFGMFCYAVFCEVRTFIRGKRSKRKAMANQQKAIGVAEDLIVFDQTMTREKLIRDWEEM